MTPTLGRAILLYLQHGSGEDETGWTKQGAANFILDNLIAQKKAKPMILVMEHGYAPGAARGCRSQAGRGAPPAAGRGLAGMGPPACLRLRRSRA